MGSYGFIGLPTVRLAKRVPYAHMPPARSTVIARAADDSLPRTPKEIQQFCRKALRSELAREEFDVMKACLIVALEEEAALSVHQSIMFENLRAQGQDVSAALASINSRISSALRSQFNTARIDSLADVVLHAFVRALDVPLSSDASTRANHRNPPFTVAQQTPTPPPTSPPRHHAAPTPEDSPSRHPTVDPSQTMREDQPAQDHPAKSLETSADIVVNPNPAPPSAIPSESLESSITRAGAEQNPKESNTDGTSSGSTPAAGVSPSRHLAEDSNPLPGIASLQRPQRVRHLAEHPELPRLLKSHTALFLHVASDVLFNLQGYRQPHREGSKRVSMDSFLMNSVLETGVGAPIVLAILFRAVCHRAGVRVNLAVLDGGSDCVLWPQGSAGESGIKVSGHTLVLDIFSKGAVMLEAEVKEFFNVESLSPSTDRDLLFALLSGLMDCNWRLALDHGDVWSRESVAQCLQAALRPVTAVKEPYHLSRAVAAAERCLLVKPSHIELHLYAAALCFLDQNLHRCLQHLRLVYGGLDALGMQCATGAIDLGSSSGTSSGDDTPGPTRSQDGGDMCDENSPRNIRGGAKRPKTAPPSVFTVRRNTSIEDVCLLRRPLWQGGKTPQHTHPGHLSDSLALVGVQMHASSSGLGVPEVKVVKRGSGRGGDNNVEQVIANLREEQVLLRRPRRSVATGAAGAAESDGVASGDQGEGSDDKIEDGESGGDVGGGVGVWEWSGGRNGELVFITEDGKKVALALTDQAPLPLDESIIGQVSENIGLLWHKTVLMQTGFSETEY